MGPVKIGVLGGTFDPVHNGHLRIAREAKGRLRLERVVFVPAREPWLKGLTTVSTGQQRLEMIKLAIAGERLFEVSTVDLDRPGPSYTEDTLADLRQVYGGEAELLFIVGADALSEFDKWRNPQRILEMCHLVAARRSGSLALDLAALEQRVPGIARRTIVLDNDVVDVSASDIRRRVGEGRPIGHLVPQAVERYIQEHRLYQSES